MRAHVCVLVSGAEARLSMCAGVWERGWAIGQRVGMGGQTGRSSNVSIAVSETPINAAVSLLQPL